MVSQRHLPPVFSATFRPFCAVFSPFFCGFRLPGAKTERTGEKWRKMGEIWGRNGRETAVAEWRWAQVGIVAGIGSSSISQYGHLWIPPEQPLGGSRARATPRGGQGEAQASPVSDPRQSAVLQRLFAPAFTDQLAMIPGSQFLTTRQGDTPSEPVRLQISGQRR